MKINHPQILLKKMVKEIDKFHYKSALRMKIALTFFAIFSLLGFFDPASDLLIIFTIFIMGSVGGITIIYFQYTVELEILKRAQLYLEYHKIKKELEELKRNEILQTGAE